MRRELELDEQAEALLAERDGVLRRSLHALPEPFLAAMARGLESHRDELVPGRLFSSPEGGGCAVGVMLRELEPETYAGGRVRFWLRDRWRRGSRSYRDVLCRNPRLKHLEWVFDDAVELLRHATPGASRRDAAALAGDWVREAIEAELRWRRLKQAATADASRAPASGVAA